MLIGIDASRAFVKNRTGIEEYSYQIIKHLRNKLNEREVVLYIKNSTNYEFYETANLQIKNKETGEYLNFPKNWRVKVIKWPRLWTQIGLSLEMLFHPVDALFIPAHTVPIIHPPETIVAIHGLEYEFCPKAYSWWGKFYMRRVIKNSCRWASKIICVSENTKRDLIKLYGVPADKIRVIYEGISTNYEFYEITNKKNSKFQILNSKFFLFIGRLEKRKNIIGIIRAFEILKEKYNIPHKLVLAGMPGYGYENIKYQMSNVKCQDDIILTGFVSEKYKWELLENADVFLFLSFYEGFGLPILEAQSAGTPVVAGDNSSMPEVTSSFPFPKGEVKNSALLINSHKPQEIAAAIYKLVGDKNLRNDIIEKGYENIKRFSWEKCANSIARMLIITNSNK